MSFVHVTVDVQNAKSLYCLVVISELFLIRGWTKFYCQLIRWRPRIFYLLFHYLTFIVISQSVNLNFITFYPFDNHKEETKQVFINNHMYLFPATKDKKVFFLLMIVRKNLIWIFLISIFKKELIRR